MPFFKVNVMVILPDAWIKKTLPVTPYQRILTISSTVWIWGHLRLISTAKQAKRSTWMVAPAAYQKGPAHRMQG